MQFNKFEQFKAALIAAYLANQWQPEVADFTDLVEQASAECDNTQWLALIQAIAALPDPEIAETPQERLITHPERVSNLRYVGIATLPR